MMYLNGTKIPGHSQSVAVGFNLASEDASGESSATAQIEKGDKGKELTVTTVIKWVDANDLTALTALAESKDANGSRTVYNIQEATANAMKVRQVKFNANFNVRKDDNNHQWIVSFNLIEYLSVPERKEERRTTKPAKAQTATGNNAASTATATTTQGATATPAATPATPAAQTEAVQPLTGFEKLLQKADDLLK